jgi:hypothetical protein
LTTNSASELYAGRMGSEDFVVQIFIHLIPDSVFTFLDYDVLSLTHEEFKFHFTRIVAIVLLNIMNSSPLRLFLSRLFAFAAWLRMLRVAQ